MTHVLDTVNSRTQLAGKNRMELLLFRLKTKQLYGINVFKIREIIKTLPLTLIPTRHPIVRGITHIRGITMPIIDLNLAIGGKEFIDPNKQLTIISEYNKTIQGFIVESVVRIVNLNWGDVHPPPAASGKSSYLIAVTEIDGELVEILDVEKILQEITPTNFKVSDENKVNAEAASKILQKATKVLVCDDSIVARKQIVQSLKQLNIDLVVKNNGKEALEYLKSYPITNKKITDDFLLVISDVEMPEMDGYTLTSMIREDENLKELHVVLHTSLSGVFNNALISKVGADQFIPKFDANILATTVVERMQNVGLEQSLSR